MGPEMKILSYQLPDRSFSNAIENDAVVEIGTYKNIDRIGSCWIIIREIELL